MAVVTDNGDLGATGVKRSDLILSVQPTLRVDGHGSNFDLTFNAAPALVTSARGTQKSSVLPLFSGLLKATLAPRLLFLDASAAASQSERDAFGIRVADGSIANQRTLSTYSLRPYLLHEFSARTSVLLRHDETLANQAGEAAPDIRSHQSVARLDVKPVPVGFLVELSRLANEYSGATNQGLAIEAARVGGTFASSSDVVFGVVIGRERARLGSTPSQSSNIYGITTQWSPSPVTELLATVERRFFGTGGKLDFRHRTPFTVLTVQLTREPVSAATSIGALAAGSNLGTYLDAILSRSLPDSIQRGVRVQNQLSSLGLQSRLPNAINVVADYAQLQTGATATWVLTTNRTTTSLSAYAQTLRQLPIRGAAAPVVPVAFDNRQAGASVEFNRRVTPQTALDVRAHWSRIQGLEGREGDSTREAGVRLGVIRDLSVRSVATVGVQYTIVRTNTIGLRSYEATAGFAGLNHRF